MSCIQKRSTTEQALQSSADVAVLPADKGNATVDLDRSVYENTLLALLKERTAYCKVPKDPTSKVQKESQKLLSEIFSSVPPSKKSLYYDLLCTNGLAPAIFGLTKTHKDEALLCPTGDFTQSPLLRLSCYLHKILAPLVGNTGTHARNSSAR